MPLSARVHLPLLAWVVLSAVRTTCATGTELAGTECAHCPAATVVDIKTTRVFFTSCNTKSQDRRGSHRFNRHASACAGCVNVPKCHLSSVVPFHGSCQPRVGDCTGECQQGAGRRPRHGSAKGCRHRPRKKGCITCVDHWPAVARSNERHGKPTYKIVLSGPIVTVSSP